MISNPLLFKENFKKNINIMVISFIIFFISLVVPILVSYTNYINSDIYKNNNLLSFYELNSAQDIQLYILSSSMTILIVLAMLVGIYSFSYLHNKKQVDFYHSLPIKRGSIFINNYFLNLISIIFTYVINILIFTIVCFILKINDGLDFIYIFKGVISNIIFYLFIYSIFVLSTILTGNKVISFLLGLFFVNIPIILSFPLSFSMVSHLFLNEPDFAKILLNSPLIAPFSFINNDLINSNPYWYGYVYKLYEFNNTNTLIVYLILNIIAIFICYKLFLIRKSEKSNVCIAFEWLKAPLKYFGVIIGAIYIGIFFNIITKGNTIWLILAIILGSILLHAIVEIIYEFDFKCAFKNWPSIIWCSIIGLSIILIGNSSSIYGYLQKQEKLPELDKVVAVDLYGVNQPLTDRENIDNIMKLYELNLDSIKNNSPENTEDLYKNNSRLTIGYKLKNGKIKYANIFLKRTDETYNIIKNILNSEEVSLKSNMLFKEDIKYINIFNNAKKEIEIENEEIIKNFLEVLKKDIALNIGKEKGELLYTIVYKRGQEESIYSNYFETIKFLEKYTEIKPEEPTAKEIDSIYLKFKEKDIQDKEIIEYLLKNSKAIPASLSAFHPYSLVLDYNARYIPSEKVNTVLNYLKQHGID